MIGFAGIRRQLSALKDLFDSDIQADVLHSFLGENILGRASAKTDASRGRLAFGAYLKGPSDSFLFQVLGHVIKRRPWNYWNRDVFKAALEVLQADPDRTLQSLHTHRHAIDTGLKDWLRDAPASQDERPISFPSTVELIRIATLHHHEYLRRAEHIFGNVLHLFWGILKKKSVAGAFDLRSALAVLESRHQTILATGYRDDIRNAIAHGEVVFTGNGIHYGPLVSNVDLLASDLLHELDRLWMTCNSLVLALIVFVGEDIARLGTTFIPPSRLAVLLSEVASGYPGFSVLDVVESDYPQTGRQLHLAVSSALRSRTALIADCSRVSMNLWRFGAREYQRFLFNIAHPGKQITSTLAIEPSKIASLTQDNAPLNRLSEALSDPMLLWYDESSFSLKIGSTSILLRANLHLAGENISAHLRAAGFLRARTRYIIRSVEDRSAGRWIRLEVTAVLADENDAANVPLLREIARCIIREIRWRLHWSRPDGLSRTVPLIGRPKYVWVRLFRRDSTVREIGHDGWRGTNLILMAEKVFGFRGHPVFVPNAQEVWRGIRLRYRFDGDAYAAAVIELQNVVNEIIGDTTD